jgi:hypothetical protein
LQAKALSHGLLHKPLPGNGMRFAFIDAWKKDWPVEFLCRIMQVTPRGFLPTEPPEPAICPAARPSRQDRPDLPLKAKPQQQPDQSMDEKRV